MFRSRALAGLIVLSVLGSLAAPATAGASARKVVNVSGTVGQLRIDHSTRADVVALEGNQFDYKTNDAEGRAYEELGYDCGGADFTTAGQTPVGPSDSGVKCFTVFYIDTATDRLATVYPGDGRNYIESHGVTIGMASATTARKLHAKVSDPCAPEIGLSSRSASLTVYLAGGRKKHFTYQGGHVSAFVLQSKKDAPFLYSC
jgi:hypothetical protein